jgi:general L-amino acid transport system substrate-binding protein
MRFLRALFLTSIAIAVAASAIPSSHAAGPTLAQVKQRGELLCGINGQLPGFSVRNERKEWVGFEIDYCRAIAAAALGDSMKVRFVPLTTTNRFDALRNGTIDVLVRNTTASLQRTARTGVRDAVVIYVDAQGVIVPKAQNIKELADLKGKTVCILRGTPYLARIEEWFAHRGAAVVPVMFDTQDAMYKAFYAGECIGITQVVSALAMTVVASGRAADYLMLPDLISKDPLAAYVRSSDEEWFDVVRWTHYALVEAEEHGITQANVDARQTTTLAGERRFLGLTPGNGQMLGLDERWAYRIVKQVGNYGEVYERNIGKGSPLKFPRGINALWYRGGMIYALPMQ